MAFANVTGILYPMVGFGEREAQILINFGASPFRYDLGVHDWGTKQNLHEVGTSKSSRRRGAVPSTTSELAS